MKRFLNEVALSSMLVIPDAENNELVKQYYQLWKESNEDSMYIYMLVEALLRMD